jgi:WD40 repeat protein
MEVAFRSRELQIPSGGTVRAAVTLGDGRLVTASYDEEKSLLRGSIGVHHTPVLLPGTAHTNPGCITIWDEHYRPQINLRGHTARINALAVLDDGVTIASRSVARNGMEMLLWDSRTGACLNPNNQTVSHSVTLDAVAKLGDSQCAATRRAIRLGNEKFVVSGEADGTLQLRRRDGSLLGKLQGHTAGRTVQGGALYSVSPSGTPAPSAPVLCLTVVPGAGEAALVSSAKGSLKLWAISRHSELRMRWVLARPSHMPQIACFGLK